MSRPDARLHARAPARYSRRHCAGAYAFTGAPDEYFICARLSWLLMRLMIFRRALHDNFYWH